MAYDMIVEVAEDFYNDLRDEPCILCADPYSYVLGSYMPEPMEHRNIKECNISVLFYTLWKRCYNNGSIPTARIESAYRDKFCRKAA